MEETHSQTERGTELGDHVESTREFCGCFSSVLVLGTVTKVCFAVHPCPLHIKCLVTCMAASLKHVLIAGLVNMYMCIF